MTKTRKFVSIQKKLIGITSGLMIFTSMALAGVITWRASIIVRQESTRQVEQALRIGQRNATDFLKNNRSTLELWGTNPVLTSLVENPSMKPVFENSLKDFFKKAKSDSPWIVSAVVHSKEEVLFDESDFISDHSIKETDFDTLVGPESENGLKLLRYSEKGTEKSMLLQTVKIKGENKPGEAGWRLTLLLDPALINKQLFQDIRIGNNGFATLIIKNSPKEILQHSQAVMDTNEWTSLRDISLYDLPTESTKIKGLHISRQSLEVFPLDVVVVASDKDVQQPIFNLLLSGVSVSLLTCIAGVFLARRSARKFSEPISLLAQDVTKLGQGHLDSRSSVNTNDEIGRLATQFNEMAGTLQHNTKAMEGLIHHGQVISSQVSFESVQVALMEACRDLGGTDIKAELLLHSKCFVGEDLKSGYYRFQHGRVDRNALVNESEYKDLAKSCIEVKSPDGKSPLAIIKISEVNKDVERLLPSLKILTNNVASSITTVQFNNTFHILSQKTKEIFTIFENIGQGIALVDEKGHFCAEYSVHLEHILEAKNLAGQSALDLIFNNSDVTSDIQSQAKTVISFVGDDLLSWELNEALLPRKLTREGEAGKKYLEVDWIPVTDELGQNVERVMVTVRDVTLLQALRESSEKNRHEMEMIHQIVSLSPQKFESFLENSFECIDACRTLVMQHAKLDDETVAFIKRNFHTIKGNSRALNLGHIADTMHHSENSLGDITENLNSGEDNSSILSNIEGVWTMLESYNHLNRKKLQRSPEQYNAQRKLFLETGKLINTVIRSFHSQIPNDLYEELILVREEILNLNSVTLKHVSDRAMESLQNLVAQDGKTLPAIEFNVSVDGAVTESFEKLMGLSFVHFFNNSIVHGFGGETEGQTIRVDFQANADEVTFSYRDSGKGLNITRLAQKAADLGLYSQNPSDEELAELIFMSGVSTAEKVTMSAGRGAGMDAVRSECQALGGNMHVVFTSEKDKNGFRKFYFESIFPHDKVFDENLEWTSTPTKLKLAKVS